MSPWIGMLELYKPSRCIKLICFNNRRILTEIRDFLILKLNIKKKTMRKKSRRGKQAPPALYKVSSTEGEPPP